MPGPTSPTVEAASGRVIGSGEAVPLARTLAGRGTDSRSLSPTARGSLSLMGRCLCIAEVHGDRLAVRARLPRFSRRRGRTGGTATSAGQRRGPPGARRTLHRVSGNVRLPRTAELHANELKIILRDLHPGLLSAYALVVRRGTGGGSSNRWRGRRLGSSSVQGKCRQPRRCRHARRRARVGQWCGERRLLHHSGGCSR